MDPSEQSCEQWSSLSGFYTAEEADFMGQLLDNCQVPEHSYGNFNLEVPSTLWPGHGSTIMSMNNSISDINGGYNCLNDDQVANIGYISMLNGDFGPYSAQITENNTDEEFGQEVIGDKNFHAHVECEEVLVSESVEDGVNINMEKSGKRSRSSMKVQKNKKNIKSRKKTKSAFISNTEEDESPDLQEPILSSEEDDFNASQKLNEEGSSILNRDDSASVKLKGKSRCDRGSSTDPQGVYAKKRRERINERLKILQSLVPNGTKVDISTMLEEAVLYVKFLQVQIKLLSSDDHWMYAPIAYNGMNIGLNLNIAPTKLP
ncbi:unnamed protein product [Lathyrus sativus]|nr:unnamed protein product [Lathyrus sativus]